MCPSREQQATHRQFLEKLKIRRESTMAEKMARKRVLPKPIRKILQALTYKSAPERPSSATPRGRRSRAMSEAAGDPASPLPRRELERLRTARSASSSPRPSAAARRPRRRTGAPPQASMLPAHQGSPSACRDNRARRGGRGNYGRSKSCVPGEMDGLWLPNKNNNNRP